MIFDIKPIARANGAAMEVESSAVPADLGLDFSEHAFDTDAPVFFKGTIQNAGYGILVLAGEARTAYTTVCARCLQPIHRELRAEVREVFRPEHQNLSEEELEFIGDDTSEFFTFKGFRIDVADAVRDNILAVLPMRELCKVDCAGICPVCGADRNKVECECAKRAATDDNMNQKGRDRSGSSPFGKLEELL